jgi:hypothetical protein
MDAHAQEHHHHHPQGRESLTRAAIQAKPALPNWLCHRRNPRHGHLNRSRTQQRGLNRSLSRAGLRVRLRLDAASRVGSGHSAPSNARLGVRLRHTLDLDEPLILPRPERCAMPALARSRIAARARYLRFHMPGVAMAPKMTTVAIGTIEPRMIASAMPGGNRTASILRRTRRGCPEMRGIKRTTSSAIATATAPVPSAAIMTPPTAWRASN